MEIEDFYEKIAELLNKEGFIEYLEVTHSKSAVDITLAGVNKGSALEYLSEITGIKLKNMLGVGDSKGDLSFLKKVGVPAAPSNATDVVKEVVKYVSPYTNIKGVMDIIRTFVPELDTQITTYMSML